MPGQTISIDMRGLGRFRDLIARVAKGMGNRAELHQRYGIQALNWVYGNFRQQGALTGAPWKKLSRNTIEGRRNKSAVVLRDTGQMEQSFVMNFSERDARVGTSKEYAIFHDKGTKPFSVSPKRAKVLAFPHAEGTPLKKAVFFPSKERNYPKGTRIMYSKGPIHNPGVPQRRMLPRQGEPTLMPQLTRATINFLNELKGRGETL